MTPKELELKKKFKETVARIKKDTELTNKDIAKHLGYTREYFQNLLGTGKVTEQHLKDLQLHEREMKENLTPKADGVQVEEEGAIYDVFSKDIIYELLQSNRDLAKANKDLAAANLKLANDHGDLVQLAKTAFNWPSIQKDLEEQTARSKQEDHPAKKDFALDKKERVVKG